MYKSPSGHIHRSIDLKLASNREHRRIEGVLDESSRSNHSDKMAQQHGHATTVVDAYGNPVAVHNAGTAGHHGQAVVSGAPVAGTGGQFQPAAAVEQKPRGILHRSSSSSSSSSSEDDGMGGRRKKGIKQKIKEKLPGGNKGNNQPQPATTTGAYGQPQGPGTYGQHAGHAGVTSAYGQPVQHGHAGTTDAYGQHGHAGTTGTAYGQQGHATTIGHVAAPCATGQKKGIMDKIKEKLPGHQ